MAHNAWFPGALFRISQGRHLPVTLEQPPSQPATMLAKACDCDPQLSLALSVFQEYTLLSKTKQGQKDSSLETVEVTRALTLCLP